jgi:hypothetical protein
MASPIVIRLQKETKGSAGLALTAWSIVMAVCLFAYVSKLGNHMIFAWIGIGSTVLLGAHLGWYRRVGSVFVAPIVSWIFAWIPVWIAAMVRDGFFEGLFVGLFLITFGWIVIGFMEFAVMFIVAAIFRLFARLFRHAEPNVIILGPDER